MSSIPNPSNGTDLSTAADREAVAAGWAARIDRGPLSQNEQDEMDAWAAGDPRRVGALARAMAVSAYLDRAAALGPDYVPAEAVPPPPRVSRRMWLGGAGAALAASLVAVAGYSYFNRPEMLSIGKGGVRRAVLADGSAVTLNGDSQVAVRLEPAKRDLKLLAGEAIFDVAKDASRPFTVAAGDVQVRAIGTSFVVRLLDADRVLVRVREGVVGVAAAGGTALRLGACEQVILRRGHPPERATLSPADLKRSELWKDGLLDLTGLTLGEAAAEFGRYSNRPIQLGDEETARRKVAGLYSTNDPAAFARDAALSLDLRVSETPDTIRLSRK